MPRAGRVACRVPRLAVSWATAADEKREELAEEVTARHGSPRIHAELVAKGHACGVNFVARVVRAAGIAAETKRKFRQTTDSNHSMPVAENVPGRAFDPAVPDASGLRL